MAKDVEMSWEAADCPVKGARRKFMLLLLEGPADSKTVWETGISSHVLGIYFSRNWFRKQKVDGKLIYTATEKGAAAFVRALAA